jgi:hypothetical protein
MGGGSGWRFRKAEAAFGDQDDLVTAMCQARPSQFILQRRLSNPEGRTGESRTGSGLTPAAWQEQYSLRQIGTYDRDAFGGI